MVYSIGDTAKNLEKLYRKEKVGKTFPKGKLNHRIIDLKLSKGKRKEERKD